MAQRPLSVLVVEDHPTITRQVVDFLEGLKWHPDHAASGALAIELATRESYDVVLLDLNLPDLDGLEVCRAIKARAPRNVPVLMLTARDAFEDKARGFRDGADDYLTKPFDLRELALRCEALARRSQLHLEQALEIGPLTVLVREKRCLYRGAPLALTQSGVTSCPRCARPSAGALALSADARAVGRRSARQRRPEIACLRAAQTA